MKTQPADPAHDCSSSILPPVNVSCPPCRKKALWYIDHERRRAKAKRSVRVGARVREPSDGRPPVPHWWYDYGLSGKIAPPQSIADLTPVHVDRLRRWIKKKRPEMYVETVEDLVQDAMMAVWLGGRKWNPKRTWGGLFGAARSTVSNAARKVGLHGDSLDAAMRIEADFLGVWGTVGLEGIKRDKEWVKKAYAETYGDDEHDSSDSTPQITGSHPRGENAEERRAVARLDFKRQVEKARQFFANDPKGLKILGAADTDSRIWRPPGMTRAVVEAKTKDMRRKLAGAGIDSGGAGRKRGSRRRCVPLSQAERRRLVLWPDGLRPVK